MKITFDTNAIINRIAKKYEKRLDEWLDITKEYIDNRTPELTRDLIQHTKIKKSKLVGLQISGSVYNDLWDYEIDVEKGKGIPFIYHKYPEWGTDPYKRDILNIIPQEGAHMFRDGFDAAKNILIEILKDDN